MTCQLQGFYLYGFLEWSLCVSDYANERESSKRTEYHGNRYRIKRKGKNYEKIKQETYNATPRLDNLLSRPMHDATSNSNAAAT